MAKVLVFFDGVCGLCNRFVDFALQRDRRSALVFAPLQGTTAAGLLPAATRQNLASVVVMVNGVPCERTAAVAAVLMQLPGIWHIVGRVLTWLPPAVANLGYDWVARRRYALFGRKETCRLPTPAERLRFLP